MPCYHPIPAWRSATGQLQLHKQLPDSQPMQLPCGTCLGCRTIRAQHWALRCRLEAMEHDNACVTTLTYADEHLPPTLNVRHLQLWLKRLRKAAPNKVRFYAAGEYGEQFGRPHYHAILFGLHHESPIIAETWPFGTTQNDNATPESISYITGYTAKKLGWILRQPEYRIDYTTGEEYLWKPPFQIMSRRPGLGATAKKHYRSWALYAINNGAKLSVPRYYKDAYERHATTTEKEETEWQKYEHLLTRHDTTITEEQHQQKLETKERIHNARQILKRALRRYE